MEKKNIAKLNRANKDIWAMIKIGLESGNLALLEKNLKRLHALQSYYMELLNFNDYEIQALKNDLIAERYLTTSFEKEWLEGVQKRSGTYDMMKDRMNELFNDL
jgi:hypothetical protein